MKKTILARIEEALEAYYGTYKADPEIEGKI